ncbi:MAG: pitrilysin family protein [Candidatus Doudnabacteria bacterium]
MKYKITTLKNGLTIVEVPSNETQSVIVDIFVKTGSRSETAKENGISHFLEHFLFKGTKKYPSAMAITEIVDGFGGEMNANTGKEHTQYFIRGHHKKLKTIFEILTDMIQNPLLDKDEMEREKGVIVEEINMYKDMPMRDIGNILEQEMYKGDPLGRDIAGTPPVVKKFTQNMFVDYLTRHYQTKNMIIGVAGKYDAKLFKKLVNQHWANLPAKKFHQYPKLKDTQRTARFRVDYKETDQAHFNLGFKAYKYTDKKNIYADVLAAVLGGGMSSRLFSEIRERRGLAYYVRTYNSNYQDTGVFDVSSGVTVDKIEKALQVTLDQLSLIKEELVSEKELKKAKEYIKGRVTLALEDSQSKLDWYLGPNSF